DVAAGMDANVVEIETKPRLQIGADVGRERAAVVGAQRRHGPVGAVRGRRRRGLALHALVLALAARLTALARGTFSLDRRHRRFSVNRAGDAIGFFLLGIAGLADVRLGLDAVARQGAAKSQVPSDAGQRPARLLLELRRSRAGRETFPFGWRVD